MYKATSLLQRNKKGSPVHVAPACVGSGEDPTTLGLMYAVFPCISARGCFQDLNPWPHGRKNQNTGIVNLKD